MQLAVQLSLPREARYVSVMRNVATCLLQDVDAPEEAVEDLRLALTEACANVVLHASGADDYSVSLVADEESCEVEVCDLGPGFDASAVPGSDEQGEAGRGLALIAALVDDLHFEREDSAMRVRLVKRWRDLALPDAEQRAEAEAHRA